MSDQLVCCENGDAVWCPREWECPACPAHQRATKLHLMKIAQHPIEDRFTELPFHTRIDPTWYTEEVHLPSYEGARIAPNVRNQKFTPSEARRIQYLATLWDAERLRQGDDPVIRAGRL